MKRRRRKNAFSASKRNETKRNETKRNHVARYTDSLGYTWGAPQGADAMPVVMVSAIIAGGCTDVLTNPLWVIRTRMQTQHFHEQIFESEPAGAGGDVLAKARQRPETFQTFGTETKTKTKTAGPKGLGSSEEAKAKGSPRRPFLRLDSMEARRATGLVGTFRGIFRNEGALAFYKGLTASLVGLSHVAVQFPAYEWAKRRLKSADLPGSVGREGELSWFGLILSSSISKVGASAITYPHEVVRARMQDQVRKGGSGARGAIEAAAVDVAEKVGTASWATETETAATAKAGGGKRTAKAGARSAAATAPHYTSFVQAIRTIVR